MAGRAFLDSFYPEKEKTLQLNKLQRFVIFEEW